MMTVERKKSLRGQLKGIIGNGGAEGMIATILLEMLEEIGPSDHAEAVEEIREDKKR